MTASATVRRSSRSGDCSRLSATSSGLLARRRDRRGRADICSPNSRLQARSTAIAFSARIFSSGSESRCGPVAAGAAQVVARRSSSSAAASSASAALVVAAPPTRARRTAAWSRSRWRAPGRAGAARRGSDRRVGGEAQRRVGARLADQLVDLCQLAHGRGQAGARRARRAGRRSAAANASARSAASSSCRHAVLGVPVHQRAEVPLGLQQLGIWSSSAAVDMAPEVSSRGTEPSRAAPAQWIRRPIAAAVACPVRPCDCSPPAARSP